MKLNKKHFIILIVLIFGILFWNTSFKGDIIFGDEGYYGFISKYITQNHIYPKTEIFRDSDIYKMNLIKQPMFLLTESFFWFFGEPAVKFMIPLFSILTALIIYIFMKKIGKENIGLFASLLYLSTHAIITYSVLNYVDTLLLLFIACTLYFGYMAFETNSKYYLHLGGIFAGLSALTKVTGPLIILLFIVYPFITKQYKNKEIIKKSLTMVLIALIVISPFIIRNFILYKDICYAPIFESKQCRETILQEAPKIQGLEFAGRTAKSTIESGIINTGILIYSAFAYSWPILLIFLFGLASMLIDKGKFKKYILLLLLLILPLFIYLKNTRIEDLSRYTLPIIIPISIIGASFINEFYNWAKTNQRKLLSIIIISLLSIVLIHSAYVKSSSLINVKTFPPGFYDAAKWVKYNTPKDSLLLSIYAQQTAFACNRATTTALPDMKEILLTNDDRSYQHLKLNGYDYIFVMHNIISAIPYKESFPLGFLEYIDNSDKFEKVYDNTNIYGQNGVSIYKIL
ncbi:MAG: glycosyltransferase family 39 protein [Candidatus Aenigmarchaeota archaeon]|nr:glycosyltransferase family 39 protein [Candidatus Aenigmarchaeota archaeon]